MSRFRSTLPLLVAAALVAAGVSAASADCGAKTAAFDSAARAKSPPDILSAYNAIKDDTSCDFDIDVYRPRAIGAMIDAMNDPAEAPQLNTAETFATANLMIAGDWRLAERLGDYYAAHDQQLKAMAWYEQGLGFIGTVPAEKISAAEWKQLTTKAAAAKIIASDDEEGRTTGTFAASRAAGDGSVGGILAPPPLRAVETEPVPLPINFYFNTVKPTPGGLAALGELLNAIKQQNIHTFRLIGHADPRGDRRYNLMLSRQRAELVKAVLIEELRKRGMIVVIATEGVGADQPFDLSALSYRPTEEQLFALERRVDFVRDPR